ncbi:MAG: hypothetical protein N2037_11035, partial [Acidimicrobiales bacterium]|nr:hypothetical protein [Acidimicrobiales bacterium]
TMVRHGASEAVVEGRFTGADGREIVVRRVIPRDGRSRAYIDGGLATASALAELGAELVDLHGQHSHQSLLKTAAQRSALDAYAQVGLAPLEAARAELRAIDEELAALGRNERDRAREVDLLRFQVEELAKAGLEDPDEDLALEREEDLLADAAAHRDAASVALGALSGDGGAIDGLSAAVAALSGRGPFGTVTERLRGLIAEAQDVSAEIRSLAEAIDDDPDRLAVVRDRRRVLHELKRKYGDTLADVMEYASAANKRLIQLEQRDELARQFEQQRVGQLKLIQRLEHEVGEARRRAAPTLAAEVEANLASLALDKARFAIEVGADPGDDVTMLFSANPGSPLLPLAKVASGGELARTMLAVRLVLSDAPPTLIFDEVDAGIGGSAAVAVGRSLSALGHRHQVLVVTHLPQVAAFADHQVTVTKRTMRGRTVTSVQQVHGAERVAEIARMLSGSAESVAALEHAEELLATSATAREEARRQRFGVRRSRMRD